MSVANLSITGVKSIDSLRLIISNEHARTNLCILSILLKHKAVYIQCNLDYPDFLGSLK